ncbi:hypothetical protein [Streptomyces sp. NPDC001635]
MRTLISRSGRGRRWVVEGVGVVRARIGGRHRPGHDLLVAGAVGTAAVTGIGGKDWRSPQDRVSR